MKIKTTIALLTALVTGVYAQAESSHLECKAEVLSTPLCGSGDVTLKIFNLKNVYTINRFELDHGDVTCWGQNVEYSGDLESEERTYLDAVETLVFKAYADKTRNNFPIQRRAIGQLKIDPVKNIARLDFQNHRTPTRGTQYHLKCSEVKEGGK